jgi:hypothetical protein
MRVPGDEARGAGDGCEKAAPGDGYEWAATQTGLHWQGQVRSVMMTRGLAEARMPITRMAALRVLYRGRWVVRVRRAGGLKQAGWLSETVSSRQGRGCKLCSKEAFRETEVVVAEVVHGSRGDVPRRPASGRS